MVRGELLLQVDVMSVMIVMIVMIVAVVMIVMIVMIVVVVVIVVIVVNALAPLREPCGSHALRCPLSGTSCYLLLPPAGPVPLTEIVPTLTVVNLLR